MQAPPLEEQIALEGFLRHAAAFSPHYATQPWAAKLRRNEPFSFREIPITQKSEIQQNPQSFIATRLPPGAGETFEKYTSGSTGAPLVVSKSAIHFQINAAENRRLAAPWHVSDHRKQVRYFKPDATHPAGTITSILTGEGVQVTRVYSRVAGDMLSALKRTQATFLATPPSILIDVLEAAENLQFLRLIETSTEAVSDECRAALARIPGCRNLDFYGSVESGVLAVNCPLCGAYHMAIHNGYVEVLMEDGTPAQEGEMGRVVATVHSNPAMPLVRYNLGDLARVTFKSPCTPGKLSLLRIYGREKMTFKLPEGGSIYAELPAMEVIKLGVKRFRMVQTALDTIEFHYTLASPGARLDVSTVQDLVRACLSPGYNVKLKQTESFPLAPSGKYLMHECLI